MQEVDNAVNQVVKEIATRYDFRGSKSSVSLDKEKKQIRVQADDDYKMTALQDMISAKAIKRGLSPKALKAEKIEEAAGSSKRCNITLVHGIETEKAKEIVKAIKESKIKVQAQIQGEEVRVSGKNRDDLQEAMALLKSKDFEIPLQFGNFRD